MKNSLLFLLIAFSIHKSHAQNYKWAKSIKGTSSSVTANSYGYAITGDSMGNLYITGGFVGSMDFDPGVNDYILSTTGYSDMDVFIEKLDSAGNFVWAKSFGGSGSDYAKGIVLDDTGNIIIVGQFNGKVDADPGPGVFNLIPNNTSQSGMFIEKLDSLGNFVWAKGLTGPRGLSCNSLTSDTKQNLYITGAFADSVDMDPGPAISLLIPSQRLYSDIFVGKYDVNGNYIWAKKFGGQNQDYGNGITADHEGNIYVTGTFRDAINFNPTGTGGALIAVGSLENAFTLKLVENGTFVWVSQVAAGAGYNYGEAVTVDVYGNVYTGGHFQKTSDFISGSGVLNLTAIGTQDVFLEKLDASGNFKWAKQSGQSGWAYETWSISCDSKGNAYMGGGSLLQKYDSSGTVMWTVDIVGGEHRGIIVDKEFNVMTTGNFYQSLDFDPGPGVHKLTSASPNYYDIFAYKLSQVNTVSDIIVSTDSVHDKYTKMLWAGATDDKPGIIKICADASQATHITFVNNTGANAADIKFVLYSDPQQQDTLRYGYFTNYRVNGDTVFADLKHPEYLPPAYKPFRVDSILIMAASIQQYSIPVNVYRAPVLMVHGIWAKRKSFKDMESELLSEDYITPLTFRADYSDNYRNAKHFSTNKNVVPDNIKGLLLSCINKGFSTGKVNMVVHSMGGILSRLYIQSDAYANDIHKLITCNTPHSGAQVTNVLLNPRFPKSKAIVEFIAGPADSGAVEDFKVNSEAIANMNKQAQSPNYLNVNLHSVYTTQTKEYIDYWEGQLVKTFTSEDGHTFNLDSSDVFYKEVFDEEHDLIVAVSSQKGGLTGNSTSEVIHQSHINATANVSVIATTLNLLNELPNGDMFAHSGYSPKPLTTSFKKEANEPVMPQSRSGSVSINSPLTGQVYAPGQQVLVNISGSSISNISLLAGNADIGYVGFDTSLATATFLYTIPQQAIGNIMLLATGTGGGNVLEFDSISIQVTVPGGIDSIKLYPETIFLPDNNNETVEVTGYFADGVVRDLSSSRLVQYQVMDNTIARYVSGNAVGGKKPGTTSLLVSYKGTTAEVPVVVFEGVKDAGVPTEIDEDIQTAHVTKTNVLKVYPNPFNNNFTIQLITDVNEVMNIELFDEMGRRVYNGKEISDGNFVKNIVGDNLTAGIYYLKVTTGCAMYTDKLILVK